MDYATEFFLDFLKDTRKTHYVKRASLHLKTAR